eukprot:TRINITY_DN11590_c0_g1_i1.p1 TRINITY_DN11590_c0_g1~~TRINITY_DN11590_c0_g1_i1.p1  ORF type:complete len:370 (+),score=123.27 TRINITY_DN11590_c0_g1_i1:67-1176(+)
MWFSTSAITEGLMRGAEQLQGRAAKLSEQALDAGAKVAERVRDEAGARGLSDVFALDERYSGGTTLPSAGAAPWDAVPEQWSARKEEWAVLTRSLALESRTFTAGPRDSADASTEGECAALSAAGLEAVDWSWTDQDTEARTAASLKALEDEALNAVRLKLVPRAVRENAFWASYWWRVRELSKVRRTSQVRVLLDVLGAGADGGGAVADRVEEEEKILASVSDVVRQCEDEMKTSVDNAALLRRMQQRYATGGKSDSPELMESVYESCKYHKQKVATLMGRLEELPADRQASVPQDIGSRLEAVNVELGTVLTSYRRAGLAPESETEQAPAAAAAEPAPEAAAADDDPFGGPLPWEETGKTEISDDPE